MGGAEGVHGPGAAAPARTLELRRGESSPSELAKLREIAAGFEAMFTNTLLGELLKPGEEGGLAGEGPGASVVQGLIETHLSDHMAKSGGLGIGRMIVESMKPLLAAQKVPIEQLRAAQREAAAGGLPPSAALSQSLSPTPSMEKSR